MQRSGELDWSDCIVAASGPSLTPEVIEKCRNKTVIAVNDVWRVMPWAAILYGSDAAWWQVSGPGLDDFAGERLTCSLGNGQIPNSLYVTARNRGVTILQGRWMDGFSTDPDWIHFGGSSGFAAVNIAIHRGAKRIRLVGFDMRAVDGRRHFFGNHPQPLFNNTFYPELIEPFEVAAKSAPVEIVNCTEGSDLRCFPFGVL